MNKNKVAYIALAISLVLLFANAYFYFFEWQEKKAVMNCVTLSIVAGNPENAQRNFLNCTDDIYNK